MKPAEHYAEAERLIAVVQDQNWNQDTAFTRNAVAAAQVHATLALAADDLAEEARWVK